ncbi:ABC transporter substrate-binding protein [Neobacillus niacini]|uniref:ABC transporter substrate-binding protein n=1 Tax=Neobacillus niacini TaxID=86668 RepID=UPI0021CAEE10|nr:ABC transporter substrate-binding protein [Neobacillus niacini]MCM3764760.1 ABC transporter substrate-binding protein [Neobacillus niacini]
MAKRSIIFICLLIMSLVVSACSGKEEKKPSKTQEDIREISVRINSDPDFLDPHKAKASLTFRVMLNVFEGLFNPLPDGSIEPAIAETYEVSDDGLVYTFKIRNGVQFHNGNAVAANDVKYSFERIMGTKTGEPLSSDFNVIQAIETPDDKTVVMKLKQPDSSFLYRLTANQSAIIPESNDADQNTKPIGTGPFQFVEYNPENNLIIEKNKDYWKKGKPYLDKVKFVFQTDNQSALLSLQGGQVDITDVPAHKISELEKDFSIIKQDNNSVFLLGFNHDKKPFSDVRVRQAINYAINKDEIIEATFSGLATKLGSNMSPAMGSFYKEGLDNHYKPDVDKAKKLLAEAGYPDGFSTTLTVSSHNEIYSNAAQVAVEQLKKVGITAEIKVIEWAKWLEDVYGKKDYDMTLIDFTGKLDPFKVLGRYVSDNKGSNLVNFNNPEYDKLMADVIAEKDEAKQIDLYKQAQEILTEEAAAVFIADFQTPWALNPKLEGFKTYPIFYMDMSEIRPKK